MFKRIPYLTFLLCILTGVSVDAAKVSGILYDENEFPISKALLLLNEQYEVKTGTDAKFEFDKIPVGNYELTAFYKGKTLSLIFFIITDSASHFDLGKLIFHKTVLLKEVTVSETYTTRHFDRMAEVKNNIIYAGKKNEVLLLDFIDGNKAQNNPRQILGRIPGMNFSETEGCGFPSNGFGLRGLNPTQSVEMNTRQNGYNITADLYGYNESYYNPSLEAVERIEVIRGASSLQFGPQFGGVVNFVMKQGPVTKHFEYFTCQTVGSYGLFSSFHSFGGQVKKLNYYAYFQYKELQGWRPNSANNALTGFAKVSYDVTEKIKLGFEYSVLRNTIQMPGGLTDEQFGNNSRQSTRARNWLNSPWNIAAVTMDYKISSQTSLSIKSTYMFSERNLVWRNEDGGPGVADSVSTSTGEYVPREVQRETFSSSTTEARLLTNYELLKMKNTLATGIRYFYGTMKRQGGGPGSTGKDFDLNLYGGDYEYALNFTTMNVAPFVEHIFRLTDKWSVTPGFRFEYIQSTANGYVTDSIKVFTNDSRKRNIPLFGIGTEYRISTTTNIYANFSQAYRPMDYSALTPIGVSSKIDPNLKDASGYNVDFGWRGTIGKFLNMDIGGYLLAYNNRIGLLQMNDGGTLHTYRTNTGNSITKGVESYIEFNPTKYFAIDPRFGYFNIYNSCAYANARYTSGYDMDRRSLAGNFVEYAPQVINRFGITYGLKNFSLTYNFSHTSKSYSDAGNTETSDDAIIGKIPAYTVMDICATYKFRFHDCGFKFKAGVNNFTDARYFTKRTDEYPGPGIIPAIGRSVYVSAGMKF